MILLVITSITLITLDQRGSGSGVIGSVRSGAHDAVAPVQRGVHDIVQPVSDWFDGITSRGSLTSENRRLRQEVQSLRNRVGQTDTLQRENDEFRRLLQMPSIADVKTVGAQVITGAPGNFDNTVQIDKGTAQGVTKGMPVLSDLGLVGRVVEAGQHSSTVLLITDPASNVAVRLMTSGATGVASGHGGVSTLTLSFVNPDVTVVKDEKVVTAGQQNGLYPAGIPLGAVVAATKTPATNQYEVTVRPSVDLKQVEFVNVMLWTGPGSTG